MAKIIKKDKRKSGKLVQVETKAFWPSVFGVLAVKSDATVIALGSLIVCGIGLANLEDSWAAFGVVFIVLAFSVYVTTSVKKKRK